MYRVGAYQAGLARYRNSCKSWPDTGQTRGSLSCYWRDQEIQANYWRDHKFWLLVETHLFMRVCVCQVKRSMVHLPGRRGIYVQLLERSSLCVCACAGVCKEACEPATGVGLRSQGLHDQVPATGETGIPGQLLDRLSQASYWRAPHCIYVCIHH